MHILYTSSYILILDPVAFQEVFRQSEQVQVLAAIMRRWLEGRDVVGIIQARRVILRRRVVGTHLHASMDRKMVNESSFALSSVDDAIERCHLHGLILTEGDLADVVPLADFAPRQRMVAVTPSYVTSC